MIASYSLNLIFIKTRKTGGTSAEIVLSSWCNGRDICPPITGTDELMRASYGGCPQNFCSDPAIEQTYRAVIAAGDPNQIDVTYRRIRKGLSFTSHDPASKIRDALPDLWSQAKKIAVDRHPYEKVVSLAYWRVARRKRGDLSLLPETIDEVIKAGEYVNYPLYTEERSPLVDTVIRYEDMWSTISYLTGNPLPEPLPRAKGSHRTDRRPACEILSVTQKRRIKEACATEMEILGYKA